MNNENNIKFNICNNIEKWFKEHPGQTSVSLAKQLGVSDTSVKRWRKGVCLPDTSLLPTLCEIMNISLLTLFGLDNTKALTPNEQRVIQEYQKNITFKEFADRYISDIDFQNAINSIVKLPK